MLRKTFNYLGVIMTMISTVSVHASEQETNEYEEKTSDEGIPFIIYPQENRITFDTYEEENVPNMQYRTTYITVYGYKYTKSIIKYAGWRNG